MYKRQLGYGHAAAGLMGATLEPGAEFSVPAAPALLPRVVADGAPTVSYTHLRAHETVLDLVCRLLLETKTSHVDWPQQTAPSGTTTHA